MKTVARPARRQVLALGPYSAWALLFILVPLLFVAYYAFTDDNFAFTLEHIQRFFFSTADGGEVHTYLLIFWRSLKLALISTAICLVLGYPIAYIMARAKPKVQKTFMTVIMIPMWMNFLIRTYAWMTILQDTGILNNFLAALPLGRIHIIGTEAAVVIGMVYDYFPYMILPLYSIMATMDGKLLEAARDLGCSSFGVLRRVVWPLSLPGGTWCSSPPSVPFISPKSWGTASSSSSVTPSRGSTWPIISTLPRPLPLCSWWCCWPAWPC